jgi:hypothetical protein
MSEATFLLGLEVWLMDIRSRVFNLSVRVNNLRFPPQKPAPFPEPRSPPRQCTIDDL